MQPRFAGANHFDRNVSTSSKDLIFETGMKGFLKNNLIYNPARYSGWRLDLPFDGSNVQRIEQRHHERDSVQRFSVRFPFAIDYSVYIVIMDKEIYNKQYTSPKIVGFN